jgi:hypothetical protein
MIMTGIAKALGVHFAVLLFSAAAARRLSQRARVGGRLGTVSRALQREPNDLRLYGEGK